MKVKRCPVCDGEDLSMRVGYLSDTYYIRCNSCSCMGDSAWTQFGARWTWNRDWRRNIEKKAKE